MQAIIESVQNLLSTQYGSEIRLGEEEELESQFTVLRIAVLQGEGLPESIIVKQIPQDARFGGAKRLLSEWAGLEFGRQIAGNSQFAPRFLAGDRDALLVVLEDMGDVPTLDAILRGKDADLARKTLAEYGRFLAQMQLASYGREAEFLAIQKRHDVTAPASDSSVDMRPYFEKFDSLSEKMGIQLKGALEQELTSATANLFDEPRFRVFGHHDAGPHNVLVTDDGLRFVDFEFSQFGHALLDMSAVRLAFPSFECGHPIPKEIVLDYENTYREELAGGIPQIADDAVYELALEQACVKWLFPKIASSGDLFYHVIVLSDFSKMSERANKEDVIQFQKLIFMWLSKYLDWYGDEAQLPLCRDAYRTIVDLMQVNNPQLTVYPTYAAFEGKTGR